MSKTFTYVLLVIGVYILIIFPKVVKATNEGKKNNSGTEIEKEEGEPETGAKGQLQYRIGLHTI